jgi:hypothetical protein
VLTLRVRGSISRLHIIAGPACDWQNTERECFPSILTVFDLLARSDFFEWVEGRALRSADNESIIRFLWEDVICRHGVFSVLVVDERLKNKDLVAKLAEKYNIKRVIVSVYYF